MHQIGDHVRYIGNSLQRRGIKKDSVGEVVSKVENTDGVVCDFGGDSYIIAPANLARHVYKQEGPQVDHHIVRKWAVDEDGNKNKKKKGTAANE